MKHFFFLIIIFFFSIKANGEITVIELYEDSVDRKILDTLVEDSQNYENLSGKIIF